MRQSIKLSFHESIGLAVYNCGFQECSPGHQWGPAMRDHYLIHYIISGRGEFTTKEQTYVLKAGDGFLATPSTVIRYRADTGDPWAYCWVGFNGSDAARYLKSCSLSAQTPIFHYDTDRLLQDKLMDIYHATVHAQRNEARTTAALLNFLATMTDLFGVEETQQVRGFDYVKKAVQYIEYNYANPIEIQDLAGAAGISRSHLYRLFIQNLGVSPNEYLIQYRINKACGLLRNNGLTVNEAAISSGFSDQLYFSRMFKKIKGVPPSKYASLKDESIQ